MNCIIIKGLEVESRIGVPEEERRTPQRLLVDVEMEPPVNFTDLRDKVARTIDYDAAAQRIAALAMQRPRQLIETLAMETAEMLVKEFGARRAVVEVRKFILPDTKYVAARCEWGHSGHQGR